MSSRTSTFQQLKSILNLSLKSTPIPPESTRKMRDSYIEIILPFSTNENLREEYVNVYGGIRFAKIIEDIDALAGSIAYKHALEPLPQSPGNDDAAKHETLLPITIVTASVDRIDLQQRLDIHEDLRLSGSSMDVLIVIDKKVNSTTWSPAASALFTMVARHPLLHVAVPVPKLSLDTPEEIELFSASSKRRARRKLISVPTEDGDFSSSELKELHGIMTRVSEQEGFSPSSQYCVSSLRLCHPQERNIHNFIFGGWLIKEAFELAFCLASVYCRDRPLFIALDESSFLIPVPLGSLLSIDAAVVYAEKSQVRIQASISLVDTSLGINGPSSKRLTNVFGFTFEKRAGAPVSELQPSSYASGLQWLRARRKHRSAAEELALYGTRWVTLLHAIMTPSSIPNACNIPTPITPPS
ncbi:acyl-thioester [Mitosporidium daphniae]|uniref:Acyl-thioester n=1 Tax=Mitosporidium daphniae TaxID=1485682 RepID=A0A098VSV7_9MICR|nr:acyl-thioester [Mitosporidium daphniae]KGG52178.1 acyl-thioester [Mitosporidium daphniae]|eukprot:XP_013238605.1 acyl-thioester [Mitosporidium daphniae]